MKCWQRRRGTTSERRPDASSSPESSGTAGRWPVSSLMCYSSPARRHTPKPKSLHFLDTVSGLCRPGSRRATKNSLHPSNLFVFLIPRPGRRLRVGPARASNNHLLEETNTKTRKSQAQEEVKCSREKTDDKVRHNTATFPQLFTSRIQIEVTLKLF